MRTLLLVLALLTSGCVVPHSTASTEVGVRTAKVALLEKKGVQDQIYEPGGTHFFAPIVNDWNVFDAALQNLEMTREANSGARMGDDSLHFKTVDGNDISVNVTVAWRIDPTMAPYLLEFVGQDTAEVGERLVRPVSRTVIRDILNELASEEYYDASIRFQKAEEARDRLAHYLKADGVVVEQVLLGEHKFNDAYEGIIRDKKVAEQHAARLQSETEAAREQMLRELEVQKGLVNQTIEAARGETEKKKLSADGIFYERERQAEAILAEARAYSEGLKAKARALQGAGGAAQVKLKLAEALKGVPIVFLPANSGVDLRTTDVNALLSTYGLTNPALMRSGGTGGAAAAP